MDLFLYYSTTVDTSVSCRLHFCSFLSLPFCCHSLRFWHPFAPLISGAPQESLLCSLSVCLCVSLRERIFVVPVWVHLAVFCVCKASQSGEVTDLSGKGPLLSHQTLICACVSSWEDPHWHKQVFKPMPVNPQTGLWRKWGPEKKNVFQKGYRSACQRKKIISILETLYFLFSFVCCFHCWHNDQGWGCKMKPMRKW